jgi:hypothetical protein
MWRAAGILDFAAALQVAGEAGMILFGMSDAFKKDALKKVDVSIAAPARLRPSGYDGQPSPLHDCESA